MDDSFIKMRGFIKLFEEDDVPEIIDDDVLSDQNKSIIADLRLLIDKLNNHMETDDTEQSLGVEMGFQRVASMIENLVKKYEGQ